MKIAFDWTIVRQISPRWFWSKNANYRYMKHIEKDFVVIWHFRIITLLSVKSQYMFSAFSKCNEAIKFSKSKTIVNIKFKYTIWLPRSKTSNTIESIAILQMWRQNNRTSSTVICSITCCALTLFGLHLFSFHSDQS